MVNQNSLLNKKMVKFAIIVWIVSVIFVYLLLYGPDQFWWVMDQLDLSEKLYPLRAVILNFFSAGYQE